MSAPVVLETRDLSCIRNDRTLFADLQIQLQAGQMLVVEGPNGCGKTSLLRILTGLRLADGGEVLWRGQPINHLAGDYYEQVNYVGHHDGVKQELSCLENLRLARAMGVPSALDLDEVLERVNLYAYGETEAGSLSAGQKRRLALARLLATEASLWILDEPFTSLDKASMGLFVDVFEGHLRKPAAICDDLAPRCFPADSVDATIAPGSCGVSGRLSLTQAFAFLLRRDLLLAVRNRAEYAMPLLFFVLVITMFPLALGTSPELLSRIAPGIIWVAALLAAMLSLESIFRSDFEDGSLEQILLSAHPVAALVLAKVCAHWLVTGLPLLLVAPVLAEMLGMDSDAQPVLLLTILIGTPILSLIGAIGVALTVGLRKGGIILSLLVLPLYVPVLIFAASATENAASGFDPSAQIYMLLAFLLFSVSLSPWATAAALRMSVS